MSDFIPKPNSFSAFKNDRRRNDRDADFTGTLHLEPTVELIEALQDALRRGENVPFFFDCWKNQVKSGKREGEVYIGGRIKQRNAPRMDASYGQGRDLGGEQQREMSYQGGNQGGGRGVGPGDYRGPSEPRRGSLGDDEIPF